VSSRFDRKTAPHSAQILDDILRELRRKDPAARADPARFTPPQPFAMDDTSGEGGGAAQFAVHLDFGLEEVAYAP